MRSTGLEYATDAPAVVAARASPRASSCIPPAGNSTPSTVSMYVITLNTASASYGESPAYSAWNENTRCSRSSSKKEATRGARRRSAPRRTSPSSAAGCAREIEW